VRETGLTVVQGYVCCKICSVDDAKDFVHRSTGCRMAGTKTNSNVGCEWSGVSNVSKGVLINVSQSFSIQGA